MAKEIAGVFGPLPPKQGTGTGVSFPPPTNTGYVLLGHLTYPQLRPFQIGHATSTPSNTRGNIGQRIYDKLRQGIPVAKTVIKKQLTTF